jgi:multiple sugar transport system ATP-binding protein
VIVGVRPEDLMLGAAGEAPPASALPAEAPTLMADIRIVEALGSETHAFFSTDAPAAGASALAAAPGAAEPGLLAGETHNGVARLDPRTAVHAGQRVTFRVDPGRLHFFDPDSGTAVR